MFATTGRVRLALALPAAAAVAGVVAGCGSSGNTTAGTSDATTAPVTTASAPATVTDTVVPPTTTTTATTTATTGTSSSAAPTATGPVACATSNLTVSLGAGEGAAGSTVYAVHFLNRGSSSCTIVGYPGVSTVAPGTGKQVGQPATRAASTASRTVTLSPGAEATSVVKFDDYLAFESNGCTAAAVSGLRVYPPNNTASAYLPFPQATKTCPEQKLLEVQPVVAGAGS